MGRISLDESLIAKKLPTDHNETGPSDSGIENIIPGVVPQKHQKTERNAKAKCTDKKPGVDGQLEFVLHQTDGHQQIRTGHDDQGQENDLSRVDGGDDHQKQDGRHGECPERQVIDWIFFVKFTACQHDQDQNRNGHRHPKHPAVVFGKVLDVIAFWSMCKKILIIYSIDFV